MTTLGAQAVGIANIAIDGTVLDTWFPEPKLVEFTTETDAGSVRLGAQNLSPRMLSLVGLDEDRMVEQIAVRTTIPDLSQPPIDAHDSYLRLHLLSHRLVKPNTINMEGVLKTLATVVWTNKGPCLQENFEFVRTALRSRGLIHVYAIDRLPRMVDYVVPNGVRIAEAERVRLGAYLAEGTTVMREGFVSFNAGSLGPVRIEGRLSSSVVLEENTKIGLSATVMAAHDEQHHRLPLYIGKNCEFGVSAGIIGINLGDNCVIGNNLIISPDSMLYFPHSDSLAPAHTIAGQSNWHIATECGHPEPVARQVEE
ncbi:DapH/DapD/GlmU-related protein [Corynebacterium epidermidicanis]|uniref:Tetrahydrodipicolinate N-succinyltransferase n=1 Tax=Corynebacterium epidermidicanis TaxID=1050174 RepID=A0A0G3GVD7_9CORY|nr:DapH/DapD/GlmU-related protein [Corynebacterium epidermidicanis]AKK02817.1 tetrahydrodipicolinate N-succinyltransferase [Corynebacterium epidermidicanis]